MKFTWAYRPNLTSVLSRLYPELCFLYPIIARLNGLGSSLVNFDWYISQGTLGFEYMDSILEVFALKAKVFGKGMF